MREAVARNLMVELKARAIIVDVIPVLPPTEPVACRKISMKGNPIVVSALKAASISPVQKIVAMSMPKPSAPLMMTLVAIERGTLTAALAISSDI